MKSQRICIYPKDVMLITGKSERYARSLLKKIKSHLNKKEHQHISINELCDYLGLRIEEVSVLLH